MSEQMQKLQTMLTQLSRWESKIEDALKYNRYTHTFDDIVGKILQGRLQFHSFDYSFAVTEVIYYPQFSVLHCFLAGGDLEAVISNHEAMHKHGAELGCRYLSAEGRRGWERVLKDRGWEPMFTTFYKEVSIEQNTDQLTFWPTYEQPAH